jgi:AcrR family transcriptional regulator
MARTPPGAVRYASTLLRPPHREQAKTSSSLYQYFPNKEGLVGALIEQHRSRTLSDFEAGLGPLAGQPLPVAMRELIRRVLAAKRENPRLQEVLTGLSPRLRQAGQVDTYELRLFRLVRTFVAQRPEALRPRNLDMAVFILVNTVEALCHAAVQSRPDYLEDASFVEELAALVLGYLRPEPAVERPPVSGARRR